MKPLAQMIMALLVAASFGCGSDSPPAVSTPPPSSQTVTGVNKATNITGKIANALTTRGFASFDGRQQTNSGERQVQLLLDDGSSIPCPLKADGSFECSVPTGDSDGDGIPDFFDTDDSVSGGDTTT